jgi:hypothetical protein
MSEITIVQEIEAFAKLAFSKSEVAKIVSISVNELHQNPLYIQSFDRGRLKGIAELRKSVFESANNGSSVAQSLAAKLYDLQKIADADF